MHLLLGNWQLIEALPFDESGLPLPSPFGPQPMGIVRFEAERMAVVVADGARTCRRSRRRERSCPTPAAMSSTKAGL